MFKEWFGRCGLNSELRCLRIDRQLGQLLHDLAETNQVREGRFGLRGGVLLGRNVLVQKDRHWVHGFRGQGLVLSSEVGEAVIQFFVVQCWIGEGDAVWCLRLAEGVDQDFRKVLVGPTSTGDATSKDIEGLFIPDPQSNVPGLVICPTVEGAHGHQEEKECGEVVPPPCLVPI